MKKSIALLYVLLLTASASLAADRTHSPFIYHVDDLGFFDNREVHSPYQFSGTYFGTRLGAEVGVKQQKNAVSIGYFAISDFGQKGLSDHGWTLYYRYADRHWSGAFGVLPRRLLQRELPDVFVDEALRYYTPNLGGALLQYKARRGQAELYCDWLSRQSMTEREIFEIVSDGDLRLAGDRWLALSTGYNARLTHFSVRKGKTTDKVYDKFMFNPYVTFKARGSFIDSFSLTAGLMGSLNRDRTDKVWKTPMGFLGDVTVDKWRFELRNRLYAGQPLMSDYEKYGTLLHRGDPYYRSSFYDRVDATFSLLHGKDVDCHATASFHFTEGAVDCSQQVHLTLQF